MVTQISTFSAKFIINGKVLIVYVEYLIDNIFCVNIGNKIYRQCVGIPDCAPLVADLFLFYYEYK